MMSPNSQSDSNIVTDLTERKACFSGPSDIELRKIAVFLGYSIDSQVFRFLLAPEIQDRKLSTLIFFAKCQERPRQRVIENLTKKEANYRQSIQHKADL